ncbi:MAG: hypothetical protein JXM68_01560, partial [Sedimentisphaerales bacterium]|nr:hypothetical protein [Sedimentisphaerales bacterium]
TGRMSPAGSIARPIGRMRPRAMRLFISDLLWPGEPMEVMQALSEHSSCVIVVQILGRLDIDPPGPGNTRLIDSETGNMVEVYLDSVARSRYIERFKRHQQLWQDACRHCQSVMTTLVADEFLTQMQMDDLVAKGVIC